MSYSSELNSDKTITITITIPTPSTNVSCSPDFYPEVFINGIESLNITPL